MERSRNEPLSSINEEDEAEPMPILFEPKFEVEPWEEPTISRLDRPCEVKMEELHPGRPLRSLIEEIDALRSARDARSHQISPIAHPAPASPQNIPFDLSMPKRNYRAQQEEPYDLGSAPSQRSLSDFNQHHRSTGPDSALTAPDSNTDSASSSSDSPEIIIDGSGPTTRENDRDSHTALTPHMMGGYHLTSDNDEGVRAGSFGTGPKIPTIPSEGRRYNSDHAMDTDSAKNENSNRVASPLRQSHPSSPRSLSNGFNTSSASATLLSTSTESSAVSSGIADGLSVLGSGSNGGREQAGYAFPVLRDPPPILTPQRPMEEDSSAPQQAGGGGIVKRYLCQRCLNHGEHWPRKGHKPFCRWSNCYCQLCKMVDERRRLNNAICRQTSGAEDDKPMGDRGKIRNPMCARCSAHGLQNRLRGHKKRCPHANCQCNLCKLVDERRDLMAKQIKLRRQQRSEISRRESSETMAESLRSNPVSLLERRQTFHDYGSATSFLNPSMGSLLKPPTDPRKFHTGSMPSTPTSTGGLDTNRFAEALLREHQMRAEQAGALMARQMEHRHHRPTLEASQQACINSLLSANGHGPGPSQAGPPQSTILLPFPVPPNHIPPTPGGHSHGTCLGCLEEQLRHELKMAELMRLLATNPTCPPIPGMSHGQCGNGTGGGLGQHSHQHTSLLPHPPSLDQLSPIESIASSLSPASSNPPTSNHGIGNAAGGVIGSTASQIGVDSRGPYGSGPGSVAGLGGRSLQPALLLPTLSHAPTSTSFAPLHPTSSTIPTTFFSHHPENRGLHIPAPTSLLSGLYPSPHVMSSADTEMGHRNSGHSISSLSASVPSHRPSHLYPHHHHSLGLGPNSLIPTSSAAIAALLHRIN